MDERHVGLIIDGDRLVGIIPVKKPPTDEKKPDEAERQQDQPPPKAQIYA